MNFLTKKKKGFALLLVVLAMPVLLIGIKFVISFMDHSENKIMDSSNKAFKKCSTDAVLEVAKFWNPGTSLNSQMKSMLKVADGVYNSHPLSAGSLIGEATPGLELVGKDTIKQRKIIDYSNEQSIIPYEEVADPYERYIFSFKTSVNPYFETYRLVDLLTDNLSVNISFKKNIDGEYRCVEEPVLVNTMPYYSSVESGYPNDTDFCSSSATIGMCLESRKSISPEIIDKIENNSIIIEKTSLTSTINDSENKLIKRSNDGEANIKVQVFTADDKIGTKTDGHNATAALASCNVDIILTIPTNAAACNVDNSDLVSQIKSFPLNQQGMKIISDDVKKTPIFQIAEEYRTFLKENFFHTQGTNVGLIPYSGKVSLPPERKEWATMIDQFKSSYFTSDQNTYQPYMRGAILYATKGEKNAKLSNSYYWGSSLTGYPIMYRCGKKSTEPEYGNNIIFVGDLLSTNAPDTSNSETLFQHMNLNPCYLGFANFLNMACEKSCTKYIPNPYYIVELTSNVNKIYEMLGAFYPIYDLNNTSNFVFIPVSWANNLLQPWTSDPGKEATSEFLSSQSKTTAGRKKAIILLVNKPDYFAHQELTYLGFNNDFSELPMSESDKIKFDTDYADITKKYSDGTAFDGEIQGQKKILKYKTTAGTVSMNTASGYYESSSNAKGKLIFPEKYLVKLVVDPKDNFSQQNSGKQAFTASKTFVFDGPTSVGLKNSSSGINFCHNLSKFKVRYSLANATITNCVLKKQVLRNYTGYYGYNDTSAKNLILSNGTIRIRAASSYGYSPNYTTNSSQHMVVSDEVYALYRDSCITVTTPNLYNYIFHNYGGIWVTYSSTQVDNKVYGIKAPFSLRATNYATLNLLDSAGTVIESAKEVTSANFSQTSDSSETTWLRLSETGNSKSNATNYGWVYQYYIENSDEKKLINNATDNDILYNRGVGLQKDIYGNDWIVFQGDGELHVTVVPISSSGSITFYDDNRSISGKIKFNNVSENTYEYPISKREVFYIEQNQISNVKDSDGNYFIDFDMENIKLVSAEITNRSYEKVIPSCSFYDGNGYNTTCTATIITDKRAQIALNVSSPQITSADNITFTNINGSILDNQGTFSLNGTYRDFRFQASNFKNNYTEDKIGFSLGNNSEISEDSTILTSQVLRCEYLRKMAHNPASELVPSSPLIDPGIVMLNESAFYNAGNGEKRLRAGSEVNPEWTCSCIKSGNVYLGIKKAENGAEAQAYTSIDNGSFNWKATFHSNNGSNSWGHIQIYDSIASWNADRQSVDEFTNIQGDYYTKNEGDDGLWYAKKGDIAVYYYNIYGTNLSRTITYELIVPFSSTNSSCAFRLLPNTAYYPGFSELYMGYVIFSNDNSVSFNSPSSNCISISNNKIKFNGKGQLDLRVYARKSYANGINIPRSVSKDAADTIYISPETNEYVLQSNGTYKISILLDNAKINSVDYVNNSDKNKFHQNKSLAMSRSIDFCKNNNGNLEYDSALIDWWYYHAYNVNGIWHTQFWPGGSSCAEFFNKGIVGDFFFNLEDIGSTIPEILLLSKSGEPAFDNKRGEQYDFSGYHRKFQLFSDLYTSLNTGFIYSQNGDLDGNYRYIIAGFTLPVNTALYFGARGSQLHGYAWQSSNNGSEVSYDPSAALRSVTKDACAKLKSDHPDARIYVIKYRKQEKYVNPANLTDVIHDYSEIDNCASSSSFIYSAENQEQLKMHLKTIANDIKKLTGYKEAKLIEK